MGAGAAAPAEDCDEIYEARPRDFERALGCFRAQNDWIMVAIMNLNGEGTPVDVAKAREAFKRAVDGQSERDADQEMLDEIIRKREAKPAAKARRVDFCRDVAQTTLSLSVCARREENRKVAKSDAALEALEKDLDPRVRPHFTEAVDAFHAFVKTESARAYQEYIDGSIRNQFAISQEALARRNFTASIRALASGKAASPPAGRRPFAAADRELNEVYREKLGSYAKEHEPVAGTDATTAADYRRYVDDYKKMSRAAQHDWIRYRDAMGKMAAARWPDTPGAEDLAKARITEDRIRELENSVGE